jgi:hypothetical protein
MSESESAKLCASLTSKHRYRQRRLIVQVSRWEPGRTVISRRAWASDRASGRSQCSNATDTSFIGLRRCSFGGKSPRVAQSLFFSITGYYTRDSGGRKAAITEMPGRGAITGSVSRLAHKYGCSRAAIAPSSSRSPLTTSTLRPFPSPLSRHAVLRALRRPDCPRGPRRTRRCRSRPARASRRLDPAHHVSDCQHDLARGQGEATPCCRLLHRKLRSRDALRNTR